MIKLSYKMDDTLMTIFVEIDIEKLGGRILPSNLEFTDRYKEKWEITFCPYQENIVYPYSKMISLGHMGVSKIEFLVDAGHNENKIFNSLKDVTDFLNTL